MPYTIHMVFKIIKHYTEKMPKLLAIHIFPNLSEKMSVQDCHSHFYNLGIKMH